MADKKVYRVKYEVVADLKTFFAKIEEAEKRLDTMEKRSSGRKNLQQITELENAVESVGEAAEDTGDKLDDLKDSADDVGSAASKLKKPLRDTETGLKKVGNQAEVARGKFQRLRDAIRGAGDDNDNFKKGFAEIGKGFAGLGKILKPVLFLGLATGVGQLITAVAALGGSAIVAAGGLAQLSGAAAAIPGGIFAAVAAVASLKIAFGGLGNAFKLFSSENIKAPETYADALAKMSPSAAKVTKSLTDLYPAWEKVQKAVQESFFSKIAGDTSKFGSLLKTLSPILNQVAGAVGDVAHQGLEMISSGPWSESFKQLGDSSVVVIKNIGAGILSIADAFRKIAVAARPLTEFLSGTFAGLADEFSQWSSSLNANSFDSVMKVVPQFIAILKNLGSVISNIFKAAGPTIDWFMDRFVAMSEQWKTSVASMSGPGGKLTKFFEDLKPVMTETAKLFGDLFRGLGDFVDPKALAPLIAQIRTELLPAVFDLLKAFSNPEVLSSFISSLSEVVKLFANLIDSGVITAFGGFIQILGMVAKALNTIADNPVGGALLKLIGIIGGFAAPLIFLLIQVGKMKRGFDLLGSGLELFGVRIRKTKTELDALGKGTAIESGLTGVFSRVGQKAQAMGGKISGAFASLRNKTIGRGIGASLDDAFASLSGNIDHVEESAKKAKGAMAGLKKGLVGVGVGLTAALVAFPLLDSALRAMSDSDIQDVKPIDEMTKSFDSMGLSAASSAADLKLMFGQANGMMNLGEQLQSVFNPGWLETMETGASGLLGIFSGGETDTAALQKNFENVNKALGQMKSTGDMSGLANGFSLVARSAQSVEQSTEGATSAQTVINSQFSEAAGLVNTLGGAVGDYNTKLQNTLSALQGMSTAQAAVNGILSGYEAADQAKQYADDAAAIKNNTASMSANNAVLANQAIIKQRLTAANAAFNAQAGQDLKMANQNFQIQLLTTRQLLAQGPQTAEVRTQIAQLDVAIASLSPYIKIQTLTPGLQAAITQFGSLNGAIQKIHGDNLVELLKSIKDNVPTGEFKTFIATMPGLQSALGNIGIAVDSTTGKLSAMTNFDTSGLSAKDKEIRTTVLGWDKLANDNPIDPKVDPDAAKTLEELNTKVAKLKTDIEEKKEVNVNADAAGSAIDNLQGKINNLKSNSSFTVDVNVSGGAAAPGGAKGGFVTNLDKVFKLAFGGAVPGTGDKDSVPAMLMPGEFVLTKKAVKKIGLPALYEMNKGKGVRKYAKGGEVQHFASGGQTKAQKKAAKVAAAKEAARRASLTPEERLIEDLQIKAYKVKYKTSIAEAKLQDSMQKWSKKRQREYQATQDAEEAKAAVPQLRRDARRNEITQERLQREINDSQYRYNEAIRQATENLQNLRDTVANIPLGREGAQLDVEEAQANVRRVKASADSSALDIRRAELQAKQAQQAQINFEKQAKLDQEALARAEEDAKNGIENTAAVRDVVLSNKELQIQMEELKAAIAENTKQLNPKAPVKAKKKAIGGRISGGRPYLMGEKGPELVWPSEGGRVMTAAQTSRLLQSSMNFNGLVPPMALAGMPPLDLSGLVNAAQTTNVSNDRSMGDVNIYNPRPERASASLYRTLQRRTQR